MKFQKESVPFTMVANEVLTSKRLSWKAKGLYAYLFSKPDSWNFSHSRIKNEGNIGRDGVLSGLKELEEGGYLLRTRLPNGRMKYELKYSIEPSPEKPYVGKAVGGKSRTISNTDTESNIDRNNNTLPSPSDGHMVNALIDAFQPVNSSFTRFYKLKGQREACSRLIKQHGLEYMVRVVSYLTTSNANPYAPTITTPDQLEMKLAQLIAWGQKEKAKKITKGKKILI